MMPSSADLTYFVEVATVLNVSRASERLGISQPSLTLSMQRLEGAVGAQLLIRSKKGVTLTQAGKQLLLHSRSLLQSWDNLKSQALASVNEVQGSFTLGCHVSPGLYSLPQLLPDLLEKYPALEINLVHDLSRKIAERVIQMEVDIGIVVNPVRHPELVIKKLCDDEVTFWVGRGDRRIQNPRDGDAVLICDPSLLQTQNLLKRIKKSGIRFKRILNTSSLELITELTTSGGGIAVLPGRVAKAAEARGLKKIGKAPIFYDEICLLFRVENKNVKGIQAIGQKVIEAFQ